MTMPNLTPVGVASCDVSVAAPPEAYETSGACPFNNISNAAGAPSASSITITDTLDANTTVQTQFSGCAGGTDAIKVDTVCTANVPVGNALTVSVADIAGGATRTISYQGIIK